MHALMLHNILFQILTIVLHQNVWMGEPVWMVLILTNVCVQVDTLAKTAKQVKKYLCFFKFPFQDLFTLQKSNFLHDYTSVEIIEYSVWIQQILMNVIRHRVKMVANVLMGLTVISVSVQNVMLVYTVKKVSVDLYAFIIRKNITTYY